MSNFLVLYGTTEGHTRKIAHQVGKWIEEKGFGVDVIDCTALPSHFNLAKYDAFVVLGSVHEGNHQRPLRHFVQEFAPELSRLPSAFISASFTAIHTDKAHHEQTMKCIQSFLDETGWTPTMATPVAGALLFTQYNWMKQVIMKSAASTEHLNLDTTKDAEYTDWDELHKFIDAFVTKHVMVFHEAGA